MSRPFSIKKYNKTIVIKIIITCLLVAGAVFSSLYIGKLTLNRTLSTVDQLSRPNPKIQMVNSLFKSVVRLDQLQRVQALNTDIEPYNPFLLESQHLQQMLDSLRSMAVQNDEQVARIDTMKKLLDKRNLLFLEYVKKRAVLIQNDTVTGQVKNLSALITEERKRLDSNVVTSSKETKTIIDTLNQKGEKQSLWKRIFNKKKAQSQEVQRHVEEQLDVRVDTAYQHHQGDSLARIGKVITKAETNRIARRNDLLKQQTEINNIGNALTDALLATLNDIETDELANGARDNIMANRMADKSITVISMGLILFIVATAVLLFLIYSDISRSNRYRKELIIAKEEAEEAGMVKQRFLANMSHELRTPLQTIVGISEQIRSTPHPTARELENIHQSSLYLLQIVNEVLDYSRIVSGKYIVEQKPFSLYKVLHEVKEIIQVQATLKKLSLIYDVHVDADAYYSGDPFRLKQILLNLLGNAIKFTAAGSVTLLVTGKEEGDAALFTFMIRDTGAGMAAGDLAIIFNQFEQGSNPQKKQGTGLGLSIVKELVELQQGTMQVQSTEGKGTTFTITIPYAKTEAAAAAAETILPVAGYKEHVWVIDDDLFILQLCDTILNKYEIRHTCISSPQEALAMHFPADLGIIFMDIRMPGMDGVTLCRRLRERTTLHQPRYIALTAQALPDEQEAIRQQGFDEVVMKPFLEQHFIGAIYRQAASDTSSTPISLDLSSVYKMVGDDKELLDITLQNFITETEKDILAVATSITDNDNHELAEALHRLAGRCGQMGASSLSQELRMLEIDMRKKESTGNIEDKMNVLYQDIGSVVAAINDLRTKGNTAT